MVFAHPTALWLLLLVIPLVAMHFNSRMGLSTARSVGVATIRATVFVLLILAVAQPIAQVDDTGETIITVVDVSDSIPGDALVEIEGTVQAQFTGGGNSESHRLIVFDRTARSVTSDENESVWESLLSSRAASSTDMHEPDGIGSSLAEALDLSGALIAHDGRGRVNVFTDGLETNGDAEAAALRLAERGITVSCTPLGRKREDEVILKSLSIPAATEVGATIELSAEIEAAQAQSAELIVRDEAEVGEDVVRAMELRPGKQTVTCKRPALTQGLARYLVDLKCERDSLSSNNSLATATYVGKPKRVAVLEDDSTRAAAVACSQLLRESAEITAASASVIASGDYLDDIDLLVVADMPAELIGNSAMSAIRNAVVEGMGLLVTGGRRSFGPGGYVNTPLEEILPVDMSQELERRDPSTTLVVIIDTSGSMGGARVELAKEIARLAVARLKPHDKVGIVEFYGSKRWAAPIQPASNAIDLQRALNRLSAGGGTVILPAIEEAFYALQDVKTRTKHVLVLTDGGVEQGAFEPLVRRMADNAITLSTVLVGPGKHSSFLASLAQWGRGRFYNAPDRYNLPEVIVKQPETSLLTPFVEQESAIALSGSYPEAMAIDFTTVPTITGYVQTNIRPTADLILSSAQGHPILASWRYGLGAVMAFTTHLSGDWTSELGRWPDYGTLLANLIRTGSRPGKDTAVAIEFRHRPGAVEIQMDTRLPHVVNSAETLELTLMDSDGARRKMKLDPIRPDQWNARIEQLPSDTYTVEIRNSGSDIVGQAALTVPPRREVTALEPDKDFFLRVEGMQPLARENARQFRKASIVRPLELWPVLVGIALVLFLSNVLLRRWPIRLNVAHRALVCMFLSILSVSKAAGAQETSHDVAGSQATSSKLCEEAELALSHALGAESQDQTDMCFAKLCRLTKQRNGNLDALVHRLEGITPQSDRALRLLARAAMNNGLLETAQRALSKCVAAHPDSSETWAQLGQVNELLGNIDEALAALENATACGSDPSLVFAVQVRRALLLYAKDDPESAGKVLLNTVREQPHGKEYAPFCAHIAALSKDYALATSLLTPHGSSKQMFHDHLFRGLWSLRSGNVAQALREYEKAYEFAALERDRTYALERTVATGRMSGSLERIAEAWLATPDLSTDKFRVLVELLRALGRFGDVLELLRRGPATEAQRELIDSPAFQRELISLAIEAGRADEAEAVYRNLIDRDPLEIESYSGLARLLLMSSRHDEAEDLLQTAADRIDNAGRLLALAESARQLALDNVALQAARKAAQGGNNAKTRAVLFEADLARQRGNTDEAIVLLTGLVGPEADDPNLLLHVAETFERYGDKAKALQLLRRLQTITGSEDVLLRLAWLLEDNQQLDEAYALWESLWKSTQVPARLQQAQERLLDLAMQLNRLADIAIEIEERVEQDTATEREISLLVDVYSRVNDPVSAREVLVEFHKNKADRIDVLKQLVRVYLSCEQFGNCNRVLRDLAKLDPDNALDYLNQVAIVALERRQPFEARRALAEIAELAGNDATSDEFSAGVLAAIGLSEEAARCYGRLLARHPDRIEGFLLWANTMRAAGKTEQAIHVFQSLLENAMEDDLFTVAVDGLLNLDAKPIVLQSAMRRVFARIAADPHKVFLYQLAADLLEATGETEQVSRVLEQSVIVAGERRGPILRELMDGALADNRNIEAIDYGRSLMMVSDHMPPQVYLDLGYAMVGIGDFGAAQRVFERASVGADVSKTQQQVATLYEDAMRPSAAEAIIQELLITEPDNVALLIRSGDLQAQLNDPGNGCGQYKAAVDILLRRTPGVITAQETGLVSDRHRRRWRAENVTEFAKFFDSAVGGLLYSAQTGSLQDDVVTDLATKLDAELASLHTHKTNGERIADNPRLQRMADLLRTVSFAFHRPDVADERDAELLLCYPRDGKLADTIAETRMRWGLHHRAKELTHGVSHATGISKSGLVLLTPSDEQIERLVKDETLDAKIAGRLLPLLIMTDREEQARQLLATAVPTDIAEVDNLAERMVCGAIAVGDGAAVRRWTQIWVDSLRNNHQDQRVIDSIKRCIRLTWNHLTEADKRVLCTKLVAISDTLDEMNGVQLKILLVRLAQNGLFEADSINDMVTGIVSEDTVSTSDVLDVLMSASVDDRAELLCRAVASRNADKRRPFLMDIVGAVPDESGLVDAIENLFRTAPQIRLEPQRAMSITFRGAWHKNLNAQQAGRRIGEVLLSENPNEPSILCATAVARNNAGAYDDALILAQETLDAILQVKLPEFFHARLLVEVAEILRQEDREAAIDDMDMLAEIDGETPTFLLSKAILLKASGRMEDALSAIRGAYEAASENRVISRRLINMLEEAGAEAELAGLLRNHLSKATIMESFEWRTLGNAYLNLHDLENAAITAAQDKTTLGDSQSIYIAKLLGKNDQALYLFRRLMADNRNNGRSFVPTLPAKTGIGGLEQYLESEGQARNRRRTVFEILADMPFAVEEYLRLLRASVPGDRTIEAVTTGLVQAASKAVSIEQLSAAVAARISNDSMTFKDSALLMKLLEQGHNPLNGQVKRVLHDCLLKTDPADTTTLGRLAQIEKRQGNLDAARAILTWTVAHDLQNVGTTARLEERFARIDELLELIDDSQRPDFRERILKSFDPTPVDDLKGETYAMCLSRWESNESGLLKRLDRVRKAANNIANIRRRQSLGATLARYEAQYGSLDSFVSAVSWAFDNGDGRQAEIIDGRTLLPAKAKMSNPLDYLNAIVQLLVSVNGDQSSYSPTTVKSLCLLGVWCAENELPHEARKIVADAEQHAGYIGEHRLWIADLARRCGLPDTATRIEEELLARDRLPVLRVVRHLQAIEDSDGQEAADRLAIKVAQYSSHPEIVKRASRAHSATHP